MRSRRSFLTLMSLMPAMLAFPAGAFEFQPYGSAAAEEAIASGKQPRASAAGHASTFSRRRVSRLASMVRPRSGMPIQAGRLPAS